MRNFSHTSAPTLPLRSQDQAPSPTVAAERPALVQTSVERWLD
jgi:hypothetical protein